MDKERIGMEDREGDRICPAEGNTPRETKCRSIVSIRKAKGMENSMETRRRGNFEF